MRHYRAFVYPRPGWIRRRWFKNIRRVVRRFEGPSE